MSAKTRLKVGDSDGSAKSADKLAAGTSTPVISDKQEDDEQEVKKTVFLFTVAGLIFFPSEFHSESCANQKVPAHKVCAS